MALITIDTEKDSAEHIQHAIDFLLKIVDSSNNNIQVTNTQPSYFNNSLPSSGIQLNRPRTADDLLNMCDDEDDKEEIKPNKGLTDFSQFMPF